MTGYYGALSARAVTRFQEKYASEILVPVGLTKGTGFFGASSRAKLNALVATRAQNETVITITEEAIPDSALGQIAAPAQDPLLSRMPPKLSFTAESLGKSVALSWLSPNANSCTASGDWSGNKEVNGTEVVEPFQPSSYILTCKNTRGSLSRIIKVDVSRGAAGSAPTLEFTAASLGGGGVTLSWNAADAGSCTASGDWLGERQTAGWEDVFPVQNSTYTLTCLNTYGNVRRSVHVGATEKVFGSVPALTFTGAPGQGNEVVLRWSVPDASVCTASGGWSDDKSIEGQEAIPTTTGLEFTLKCTNEFGAAEKTIFVKVVATTVAATSTQP